MHGRGKIRLCGTFGVELDGREMARSMPRRQLRLLCAYLVLTRDRSVTRDELAWALWPGRAPPGHQATLSTLLSRLRRVLEPTAGVEGRSELRLVLPEDVWVDVEAAEAAAREAEAALAAGDLRDAAARAGDALAVAERELLAGHDAPWLDERRRGLGDVAVRGLECLARAGLGLGAAELTAAERAARRLTEREPYRESGYRFLMEVHEARGEPAEALRVYEALRVLLREELGTAPAADLQARHARLLALGADEAPEADDVPPPPVPPALRSGDPFVGREPVLSELRSLWERAGTGEAQTVLVGGEAGIGKTRLCAELGATLHAGGASILYGRCDEEATVPYQPFVEALAHHAAHVPPGVLRTQLAGRGGELARLLPDLRRILPDLPEPLRGQPETQRYRLFEETATLVAQAARSRPQLIVVDDLHWADRATLLLLRHLARAHVHAPLLLLGTYRTTEVEPAQPLAELLADLRREELALRLTIDGLDEQEVGTLISAWSGRRPSPELTHALHSETEGNPFFIREVVRHLGERDPAALRGGRDDLSLDQVGVPEGVHEAIHRRLSRLSDDTNRVLREAAVIGRDFDFDALTRVADLDEERVLAALEQAADAHLLLEVPGAVGRYSFSHALVRAALYESLGATRRAQLHGRVGAALEALHADDVEPHLADIARHHSRATGPDALRKAIDYSSRAGRRALSQLAYEEAVDHYEHALRARERPGEDDDEGRCRLLIDLGRAQNRAGDSDASKRTFREAAALARRSADAEALTRAALGYAGPWLELGTVDDVRLDLLEQALAAVGPEDGVARAGLLSRLALEAYYAGPERRERLSRDAVEMARRLGDGVALARALMSRRVAIAGSPDVEERLAVTTELVDLARAGGAAETALWGYVWRSVDLLDKGDVAGAYADFDAYAALARELRQPAYLWQLPLFDGMRALFEGRLGEVDALIAEGLEIGRRAHDPNAANYFGILGFMLRWAQGRLDEIEDRVQAYVERYPAVPAWRCGLALLHAELGRTEEASAELGALARDRFAAVPEDINWLPAMAWLAMTCGLVGDGPRAAQLYDLLAPHAGRNMTTGHPIFCLGAVTHHLGVLAAASGRVDAAAAHFEDALVRNAAMGARPLVAHTRHEYACALLARGLEEDRCAAECLLREARELAGELGMAGLARRAAATGAEHAAAIS